MKKFNYKIYLLFFSGYLQQNQYSEIGLRWFKYTKANFLIVIFYFKFYKFYKFYIILEYNRQKKITLFNSKLIKVKNPIKY